MRHAIALGDVLENLRELPDNAFDGILCDPPYGLSFMGKKWDYDVPSVEVWREALRVLKPGAPLLAFGGSRTFHRICVGVEDAGFELRDVLQWLYGSGFPKSLDVSKAISGKWPSAGPVEMWSGYGTALKPAYEPIILARKPLDGTVAGNVAKWGVGGLAIDACRIGYASEEDRAAAASAAAMRASADQNAGRTAYGRFENGAASIPGFLAKQEHGRWPANLILDEEAAAELDAAVGDRPSTPYRENIAEGSVLPLSRRTEGGYSDSGGPSRFFYTAKVSSRERDAGCEALPMRHAGGAMVRANGTADARIDGAPAKRARNPHPTLKPIALTQWLARLILPPTPGATLLVPYSGAGSEMIGALRAGWPAVFGIEGEAEYVEIANARIAHWMEDT